MFPAKYSPKTWTLLPWRYTDFFARQKYTNISHTIPKEKLIVSCSIVETHENTDTMTIISLDRKVDVYDYAFIV